MTDAELVSWMTNSIAVIKADPAKYKVTAAQIAALEAKCDDLIAKMNARVAADDAAKAATAAQTASRDSAEPECVHLTTIIRADPNISDADKIAIGIEPRKAPTYTAPVAPTDLIVNGYENGTNVLKWNRAGNKPNTIFIVEYREEGETDFKFLGTTTETSYDHKNATVGKQCAYRVKTQRSGEESAYSNVAVVYMK